jgi:hypothetical protein
MRIISLSYKRHVKKIGRNFRSGNDVSITNPKLIKAVIMGISFNMLKSSTFNIDEEKSKVIQYKNQYPFTDEFHQYLDNRNIRI